jgi:hypothetical protein
VRQKALPKLYAVSGTPGTLDLPAVVVDATSAGLTAELLVPTQRRWKITRKDGISFYYWAGNERWMSAKASLGLKGETATGLRRWLGLDPARAA